MSKQVVSREQAEQEIKEFFEEFDLEYETDEMSEDDQKHIERIKHDMISWICKGRLKFNENLNPVVVVVSMDNKEVVINEPCGKDLIAQDKIAKQTSFMGKMFKTLEGMTELNMNDFHNMPKRDYKIFTSIAQLFMGA